MKPDLPSSRLNSSSPPQVLSFVSFVCFAASTAAAFVTVPLLEFLAALFLLFAYSTKLNERFKGFGWPLMVSLRVETLLLDGSAPNLSCYVFSGFSEMRDCLHHLFHCVYSGSVQIHGWLL